LITKNPEELSSGFFFLSMPSVVDRVGMGLVPFAADLAFYRTFE